VTPAILTLAIRSERDVVLARQRGVAAKEAWT